jgi:PAS domain S-box-containing protein
MTVPLATVLDGDLSQALREVYEHMREGFAYCQMIAEDGEGCDFIYLAVNSAFETLTGLRNVVGRRATEAIPGIRETDPELLQTYARVARTGVAEKFEMFVEGLQEWFSVSAYSPKKDHFAAVFDVITARKEMEKALRESEQAMRALFDEAPLPYHEIDRNGIVVRVNRTECELLGVSASEMVGRPISDFVKPEEREESRAIIAGTLHAPGVPTSNERTFRSPGGAEFIFQIHNRPIIDAAGNVAGIRSAMIDVTETKRLSAGLAKERQLLNALMDQSPDHIYFKDTEGRFTLVNAAMASALGCSDPTQAIRKTDSDFFSPEHAEPAYRDEQDLVEGRATVVSKEEKETWPDGRETWVFTTKLPLRDPAGKIIGTFGISRNITERRRAECAFRETEDRLTLVLESLNLGTWDLDLAADRAQCSPKLLQLYGRPGESLDAARWLSSIHPDDRQSARLDLDESIGSGKLLTRRFRVVWPDGTVHWLHSVSRVVCDAGKKPVRVIGMDFDVTELAHSEEQVRKLSTAVEQSPVSIVITDLQGNIEYVNRKTTEVTGYAAQELIGQNSRMLKSGETSAEEYGDLWRTIRNGGEWHGTLHNRKKNGELFWESAVVRPIFDPSGKPTHYLAVKEDITARKLAEDKIAWLASFPEQAGSPVAEIEVPGGMLRYLNPAARDLLSDLHKQGLDDAWLSGLDRLAEGLTRGDSSGVSRDVIVGDRCFAQTVRYIPETRTLRVYGIDISERKRAEDALRESEDRYRKLFDTMIEGFCIIEVIFDPDNRPIDYRFLEVNPAFEGQTGLKDARGRLMRELAPDHEAHWFELYGQVALTGQPARFVNEARALNRWYDVSAYRIGGPESRKVAILFNDITEAKQAEDALRRSETKYRAIYDLTRDAVMLNDESGFIECNQAALAMFGVATQEEFCKLHPGSMSPLTQACGGDSFTLANQHIAKALETGSGHFEWVHRRMDNGAVFSAEVLLCAMELDGRRVLQGVVRDITERKQAEDALRESELKYRTLVKHIPQRIVYKDRESVYVSCNDLFAQDVRIRAAEIAGKTDFDFYPNVLAEKYRADDRRIMELGRTVELEEEHVSCGKPCTVLTLKTPVIGEQGDVIGILVVFTDITERKRVEESLRESERQLRLAQKLESIGQLAAGIAHEINTPVQYIGDNTQFLSSAFQDLLLVIEQHPPAAGDVTANVDIPYLRIEIPNAIAQMQEGVDRVAKIVRAMKRFSHPGPADKVPVDIHQAIESTILVSRNEWKYVADLTTDFDPEMPPVPCIVGEFNQVILNLIVNATHAIADVVKKSGGKGAIAIATRKNGEFAEIRVSDTGGGIPKAIRARIFDPFFTTKEVGKGTGQGLAIAHSVIVQKHRGTIHFESEMGKGTTFIIQLPLVEGKEGK